ncbi:MAG: sialate O-acetylesterase [Chitinophagaceae bacterium]|nr:MAG: sialate O-acetylesterase [Chitinophagaceae bacterium]
MKFFVKILVFAGFCFFMSLLEASSQSKVSWDSTYRPDVYNMLVEGFRTFPPRQKDIVFLGNNITFWGDWKERLKNCHVKNQGIPGDITFGVIDRLKEAISGKPSKIFILVGVNDIARHIPDSVIVRNYARIINYLQVNSPSTIIFFQTLLPTNPSFHSLPDYYHKEKDILEINAALKKIALSTKIKLIDLYPHFVDSSGNLKKDFTWDGVHLTQKGYTEWVQILKTGHYLI